MRAAAQTSTSSSSSRRSQTWRRNRCGSMLGCAGSACRLTWSCWMRRPFASTRLSAAPWSSGRCAKARCLSSPDHVAVAELMLAKARADLSAARLLANHEDQDDGIIGFHAQQACEKALKAMLAVAAVDIPLTHNLQYLIELVEPAVGEVPDAVRGCG